MDEHPIVRITQWHPCRSAALGYTVNTGRKTWYSIPLSAFPKGVELTFQAGGTVSLKGIRMTVIEEQANPGEGASRQVTHARTIPLADIAKLQVPRQDDLWYHETHPIRTGQKVAPRKGFAAFSQYAGGGMTHFVAYHKSRAGVLALFNGLFTHESTRGSHLPPGLWHQPVHNVLHVFIRRADLEMMEGTRTIQPLLHMRGHGKFGRIQIHVGKASVAFTPNVNAQGELALYRSRVLFDWGIIRSQDPTWYEVTANELPWVPDTTWDALKPTFSPGTMKLLAELHTLNPYDDEARSLRALILYRMCSRFGGVAQAPYFLHNCSGEIRLPDAARPETAEQAIEHARHAARFAQETHT